MEDSLQSTEQLYDYVPLPERKPLKWPNGKRLALMITLNLEYWELTQDHDGTYFAGGPSINERLLPARSTDFMINYRDDRAKEKAGIGRVGDLIEKTTGKRPAGWLSSSLRCTVNTSDICKELGLISHCDYMNDEQPYLIKTAHGPIVSAPYTQEANDIGMFLRRNLTADEAFGLWKDEFDELYRSGEKSGRMMSIGLHPH